MGDGICFSEAVGKEAVELSSGVEEVVVGVDDDDCCIGRRGEERFGASQGLWRLESEEWGMVYNFGWIVQSI